MKKAHFSRGGHSEFHKKKAPFAHKGHSEHMHMPNFQNFTCYQFNYWQIKFRLSICSFNVNFNHYIGQN